MEHERVLTSLTEFRGQETTAAADLSGRNTGLGKRPISAKAISLTLIPLDALVVLLAAFAAHEKRLDEDPEAARAYLADRLERFARDLEDGGAARLRGRDRARAEADGLVRERRREELERIRHGDEGTGAPPGAVKKTWPSRGKRDRGGGGGGGGARPGLGLGRAEEARDDAFAAFRKKRSGTYHAMIGADRGK